jgi:hypothetical protein
LSGFNSGQEVRTVAAVDAKVFATAVLCCPALSVYGSSCGVTQSTPPAFANQSSEILALRQALQVRDQLIQQLSQELFRLLMQPEQPALSAAPFPDCSPSEAIANPLHRQLQEAEAQLHHYQSQLVSRDSEIAYLTQTVQELRDRNHLLAQTVRELPEVYRQKFTARLAQVQQQVDVLQQENRRLQTELQTVSYELALLNRKSDLERTGSLPKALPASETGPLHPIQPAATAHPD